MRTVRFVIVNKRGRDVEVGSISWDGKEWSVSGDAEVMQRILERPVSVCIAGNPVTVTKDAPETFLAMLPHQYHSVYLRAVAPVHTPPT